LGSLTKYLYLKFSESGAKAVREYDITLIDSGWQESKVLKFLGFMWNPLSWVMEAAAIMALALSNGGVSARQC
jgi:hypothetical protein